MGFGQCLELGTCQTSQRKILFCKKMRKVCEHSGGGAGGGGCWWTLIGGEGLIGTSFELVLGRLSLSLEH